MAHVIMEDMVVTNITAKLMANAGLVSFDIATKEQSPRNLDRITL
jgi:hypothetical protein